MSPSAPPALRRLADGRILLVWNNSLKPKHVFNRLVLTDHFTWPSYAETGKFGCSIWADGEIVEPLPEGELVQSGVKLTPGKWHTLEFAWNCKKQVCILSLDGEVVTELSQMAATSGISYLRLWSSAKDTDVAGLLVESVEVTVR